MKQITARAQPVSTRMNHLFCIFAASLVAWSLALPAFAQNGNEPSKKEGDTSENWVLKAGDQTVSQNEFNRMLEMRKKRAQKMRSKMKGNDKKQPNVNVERLRKQVKEQLIDQLVLRHHANNSDVQVTDEELERKWSEFVSKRFGSEAKLKSKLKSHGESVEDLRQKLNERLLVKKYIQENTTVKVSNDEVRSWYEQNKKRLGDRSYEEVRKPIKNMLEQKKISEKRAELAKKLKDETNVEMNF